MKTALRPRPDPLPWQATLISDCFRLPLFFLSTALFGSVSLALSLFDKQGVRQHAVAVLWARASLWISGCALEVVNGERLRFEGPAVLVANHLSYMDTPAIFASLPFQFRIVARQSLWKMPFIGWHLERSGQIPVNTTNPRASIASLGRGVRSLQAGMPLFLFPEGGRSPDGLPAAFLNGPAYMAIRSRVPVLPIAIVGTHEVLPMHGRRFYPGRVFVVVGEQIAIDGLSLRDVDALTERLREAVIDLYFAYSYRTKPEHGSEEALSVPAEAQ